MLRPTSRVQTVDASLGSIAMKGAADSRILFIVGQVG